MRGQACRQGGQSRGVGAAAAGRGLQGRVRETAGPDLGAGGRASGAQRLQGRGWLRSAVFTWRRLRLPANPGDRDLVAPGTCCHFPFPGSLELGGSWVEARREPDGHLSPVIAPSARQAGGGGRGDRAGNQPGGPHLGTPRRLGGYRNVWNSA